MYYNIRLHNKKYVLCVLMTVVLMFAGCGTSVAETTVMQKEDTISQEAQIATFNTLHLGWDNDKDYDKLAEIVSNFDLVGLEEVMNENGLKSLVGELNNNSDETWLYHISSEKVGRSSYKEHYAFVYNDSVTFLESEGFYPDGEDHFEREPYGSTFRIGNFDFTYVLLHSVFGDSVSERRAEASELDEVYRYFQNGDPLENDILIAGDYNLPANDPAFDLMIIDGIEWAINPIHKTSIGKKGLVSAYDNIFYSDYTEEVLNGFVYDFTNDDYAAVRKTVSDHLPVYITVDITEDDDMTGNESVKINAEVEKEVTISKDELESTNESNVFIVNVDRDAEIVVLKNKSSDCDMTGWTIVSEVGHQVYEFPEGYVMEAGESIEVVSGKNEAGLNKLKWTGKYIWNNDGDPCLLYNDKGAVVSEMR